MGLLGQIAGGITGAGASVNDFIGGDADISKKLRQGSAAFYDPNRVLTNPGGLLDRNKQAFSQVSAAPAANNNQGIAGGVPPTQQTSDPYVADPQAAAAAAEKAQSEALLRDLLGRLDTGLGQGIDKLNTDYQSGVNQQEGAKAQALVDYQNQRDATLKDRQAGYGKINAGANAGYRSLAQIIGRGAGTGSSAFQDVLPNAVGHDISAKRGELNDTYASNLGNIDTAQKKTELSFENILADLARQRQAGEQDLRTGVEGQRQQAQGALGNTGAVIDSRNRVEQFFNQFKPQVQAGQATVDNANIDQYKVDRSNVNAQQQTEAGADPANPYADLLRKRLQEQTQ